MLLRQLVESKSSSEVAIIFGRFNPPHKGHRAAWKEASETENWYIGTNKDTLGPKDPLPYKIKIQAMKAIWPKISSHIVSEKNWLSLATFVYKKHGDVTLLCYTDEDWVKPTIEKYNGVQSPQHGYYKFSRIIQQPTPRLSSATEIRNAVLKGDRKEFSSAAGISSETLIAGKPYFDLVAEYLQPYQKKPKIKKKEPDESIEDGSYANKKRGVGMSSYVSMRPKEFENIESKTVKISEDWEKKITSLIHILENKK